MIIKEKVSSRGSGCILGLSWLLRSFRDHLGGHLPQSCHDAGYCIRAHVTRALKELAGCGGQDGQVTWPGAHGAGVGDLLHLYSTHIYFYVKKHNSLRFRILWCFLQQLHLLRRDVSESHWCRQTSVLHVCKRCPKPFDCRHTQAATADVFQTARDVLLQPAQTAYSQCLI